MQPKGANLGEKFDAIDTDANGGITADEVAAFRESQGKEVDQTRLDNFFAKADADGNGEISQQELKDRFASARRAAGDYAAMGMKPLGGEGKAEQSRPLDTLLQALSADTEEGSEEKAEIERLIEELQAEGNTQDSVNNAIEYIQNLIPQINIMA